MMCLLENNIPAFCPGRSALLFFGTVVQVQGFLYPKASLLLILYVNLKRDTLGSKNQNKARRGERLVPSIDIWLPIGNYFPMIYLCFGLFFYKVGHLKVWLCFDM